MTKATALPQLDAIIRLPDGRRMAYSEWGDRGGRPIILINGTPTSRLLCPDAAATEAAGVRLITIDRPGYGRSDPRVGRSILDWVDDFVELAAFLDLPPSPVIGWSAGGPYAMALGYRLPERVPTLALAASLVPFDEFPEFLDALPESLRAAIELLRRDRAAGTAAFEKERAWFSTEGWETMFAHSWGDADDRVLADPPTMAAMKAMVCEAAHQGSVGFVADSIAMYSPWGFSVTEIEQPVHVFCGAADRQVEPAEMDFLVEAIPAATFVRYPDEGHLFVMAHWGEMLAAVT